MLPIRWLCPAPSPYHQFFFSALARDPEVALEVVFTDLGIQSHPWQSELREGFRSSAIRSRGGVDWSFVRGAASDDQTFYVFAGWNHPTSQLALTVRRGPFATWTDTPNSGARRWWGKEVLRASWLRFVFRRASFVAGTGRPGVAALQAMGADPSKLTSLPFFVPLPPVAPRPLGGILSFCTVGRLENAKKGTDVALKAFARARENGFTNFRFLVAGDGPDRASLERLTLELGLRDLVEFLGWLEPADLERLWLASDALVHPALYDPFPVAVLEAMAHGVPVLASSVSGSAVDRVDDGVNGWLHTPGDHVALSQAIESILGDPRRIARAATAARARAEEWPVERGVQIVKGMARSALEARQMR